MSESEPVPGSRKWMLTTSTQNGNTSVIHKLMPGPKTCRIASTYVKPTTHRGTAPERFQIVPVDSMNTPAIRTPNVFVSAKMASRANS